MRYRQSFRWALVCVAVVAAIVLVYLRWPPARVGEVGAEAPPPVPALSGEPTWVPDLRPPQPAEVLAALERAFPGAIPPVAARAHWAVTGDFNGDDSPDLVVPARPLEELLTVINGGEMANWIVQDPAAPRLGPEPKPSPVPVVVKGDDTLLAVVHGHEGAGWRNPEARQAYLLKVSQGGKIQVQKRRAALLQAVGAKRRLPYLRGDLILEEGGRGFLYWTGARYVWYRISLSGH